MKTPLNNLYKSTKPLLDIFIQMKKTPNIAVQLPSLADVVSGLCIAQEKPHLDSSAYRFSLDGCIIYTRSEFHPSGYNCIGKVTKSIEEPEIIGGKYYCSCETQLETDWFSVFNLERYLRFESEDFMHTLYGELFTMNGLNSGHNWSGILIKPWFEIISDLSDPLVSPKSGLHPSVIILTNSISSIREGLYSVNRMATQTHIPVSYLGQRVGFAEGFRIVRLGEKFYKSFTLYEYDKSLIPENLWWKNNLISFCAAATAGPGRCGVHLTRIDIDVPPTDIGLNT